MSELELKPLLLALAASLLALFLLVIVWPRFFPPDPAPFVERLLSEIRSQNYDCVYGNLSDRWRRQSTLRDFVAAKMREEKQFIKLGGFVETTSVDAAQVVQKPGEAYVPVTYRMKALMGGQSRTFERQVVVKLVYESTRWRLDGISASRP